MSNASDPIGHEATSAGVLGLLSHLMRVLAEKKLIDGEDIKEIYKSAANGLPDAPRFDTLKEHMLQVASGKTP